MQKLLTALLVLLFSNATAQSPCGTILTDTRDGQTYNTVLIGTQCWMEQNLNYGTMINGSSNQADNGTVEKFCFNDSTENCDALGGLYQWNEMMEYTVVEEAQGICPTGWHLPSDAEWKTLEMYLGMSSTEANLNNSFRGTDEASKLIASGSSGFNALYSGARNGTSTDFGGKGSYTLLWTSSIDLISGYEYRRGLYDTDARVWRSVGSTAASPDYGYAVRCVQDTTVFASSFEHPNQMMGLNFYPNPTTGILHIQAHSRAMEELHIELISSIGRLVETVQLNGSSTDIDLSEQPNGIYFIRLTGANRSEAYKVIKQ